MKKIILTFSLLCAVGLLVYLTTRSNTIEASEPTVFYQSGIIDSIDAADNPVGRFMIVKKESSNEVENIYTSDQEDILFNENAVSFIDGSLYVVDDLSDSKQRVRMIGLDGNIISEDTYAFPDIFYFDIRTSPDGQYHATVTETATGNGDEPSLPVYGLTIKDQSTGLSVSVPIGDFQYKDVDFNRLRIVDYNNSSRYLYLELMEFYGDISNPTMYFRYDLTNSTIEPMFGGGAGITTLDSQPYAISYLSSNQKKTKMYFSKQNYDPDSGQVILAYNVANNSFEKVMDIAYPITMVVVQPDGKGAAYELNDRPGVYYYNFQTGATRQLTSEGYFKDWSKDGKYFVYTIIQDMMDTQGPQKVILRNFETNKESVIYEQKVSTFLEGYKARVGDKLYNYLSIK